MSLKPNAFSGEADPARNSGTPTRGIYVATGQDRYQSPLDLGRFPVDCKVSTDDSNRSLYIFEHKDMGKGGPHRHFHFEQDEWFYVIKGEFAFEIGDEKFMLNAGDSIFAPRKIPHVWAHVDDNPGQILIILQPAGSFERFFQQLAQHPKPLTREETEALFSAHGMQIVGEPLEIK
jgi:mannose-6-phosphate isomerase-like protein (cupin superfamily)